MAIDRHLERMLELQLVYRELLDNIYQHNRLTDIYMNKYQELAKRTLNPDNNTPEGKLEEALMGLNGEAGECIDILKKIKFQGHSAAGEYEHMIEELGDTLFYLAMAATALGENLSTIAEKNLEKTHSRYPNGFESNRSVNRGGK